MKDINRVTLIGRLTRDAELKYTPNGKAVSKFSIAVNERRKDGDQWKDSADFFEVALWGQLAESINKYLAKGKQIAVTGKLSQDRWQQDGQNRSKVTITAATVQLLGGNIAGESDNAENHQSAPRPAAPAQEQPRPPIEPGYMTPLTPQGQAADDGFSFKEAG